MKVFIIVFSAFLFSGCARQVIKPQPVYQENNLLSVYREHGILFNYPKNSSIIERRDVGFTVVRIEDAEQNYAYEPGKTEFALELFVFDRTKGEQFGKPSTDPSRYKCINNIVNPVMTEINGYSAHIGIEKYKGGDYTGISQVLCLQTETQDTFLRIMEESGSNVADLVFGSFEYGVQ